MSHIEDDPREVLALLNSLGFVGITASQLKAFIKDLKIYRKIKEHEKQVRREEIKSKILSKQQYEAHQIYNEEIREITHVHNLSPNGINSKHDSSMVEIKIKCYPRKDESNHKDLDVSSTTEKKYLSSKESHRYKQVRSCKTYKCSCAHSEGDRICMPVSSSNNSEKYCVIESKKASRTDNARSVSSNSTHFRKTKEIDESSNVSPTKNIVYNPAETVRSNTAIQTKSSTSSEHKSFIRPRNLQPNIQNNPLRKKSDPVSLYQKYQKEWKKISFPGEEKHKNLRWAIREKMLGAETKPMLHGKSASSLNINDR